MGCTPCGGTKIKNAPRPFGAAKKVGFSRGTYSTFGKPRIKFSKGKK